MALIEIKELHLHVAMTGNPEEILSSLKSITSKLNTMGQELDTLKNEVSETKTVIQSAITLIKGFKAQLDAAIAAGDPAALTDLSNQLDSSTNELAAAVAENTPASNEPPTA